MGLIEATVQFSSRKEKLDAKLRRLVHASREPSQLVAGAEFVRASANFDNNQPDANEVTRRVLVKVGGKSDPSTFTGFADLQWSQITDDVYTVDMPLGMLEQLANLSDVEFVSVGNVLGPALSTSVAETNTPTVHEGTGLSTPRRGNGVIVGIIDFGFDFTLDDFRHPNGKTRVLSYWNQRITPQGNEASPAGFAYGVEYSQQNINDAIVHAQPFSQVRNSDAAGPALGIREHGTHVAGIAVGNGRSTDANFPADTFVGVAPEADIILVQPDSSDATSSFTDSVHVADAVRYIFDQAGSTPCVVNMSLGQNGGSHDGESTVERAIDRLLEIEPGRVMVVAAGNEHIWRGHASGTLNTGESRTLHWKVGGQLVVPGVGNLGSGTDRTRNEMEIWYSSRDQFRVRITSPMGDQTPFVDVEQTRVFTFGTGEKAFVDSRRFSRLNGDAQVYIALRPSNVGVSSGEWDVEIQAVESREGRFDAWIERDARIPENNFADQSFFVGNDFDPVMTLGTPATNRRAVAVANYDHVTQGINRSSSRGPTRDGRPKPEVAAPGTNIVAANSLGGRTVNGNDVPVRTSMSGTSMSAPHVAGIAALVLEANPRLTAAQVAKILIASARPQHPSGSANFDNAFGYGRIDASEAVRLAEQMN